MSILIGWTINANGEHVCNSCSTTHVAKWTYYTSNMHSCYNGCGYGETMENCTYEDGKCAVCFHECDHNWDSSTGFCNQCGKEHDHNWLNLATGSYCRKCIDCGYIDNDHYWNACECYDCGYTNHSGSPGEQCYNCSQTIPGFTSNPTCTHDSWYERVEGTLYYCYECGSFFDWYER